MNKFAERLKKVLAENNVMQKDLAIKLNVAGETISHYCTGKREPSLDMLLKISRALGETTDYLLGND